MQCPPVDMQSSLPLPCQSSVLGQPVNTQASPSSSISGDGVVHVACRDVSNVTNTPIFAHLFVLFVPKIIMGTNNTGLHIQNICAMDQINFLSQEELQVIEQDVVESRLAHVACKANDIELLRTQLCSNAFVVNAVDPISGDALVHVVCRDDRAEMLSLLLTEYNADASVLTRDNKSAVTIAYERGHISCLRILAGQDVVGSRELLAHFV